MWDILRLAIVTHSIKIRRERIDLPLMQSLFQKFVLFLWCMLYFLQFNRLTNSLSLLSYSDCIQYGKVSIYFTTLTQFTSDSINRSYLLTLEIRCKRGYFFTEKQKHTLFLFPVQTKNYMYVIIFFLEELQLVVLK